MAKRDRTKQPKQSGGVKLPKRIGGVKVPKQWRRRGEDLIAQAQGPAGQAVIAQGMSLLAGLAAAAARAAATPAATPAAMGPAVTKPVVPLTVVPPVPETPPGEALAKVVTAGIDAALGRLFAAR